MSAFVYPTARPYVTSHYGMRYHPVYKQNRLHAGTDYRAWQGKDTELYAIADGVVEAVDLAGTTGGGKYVRIRLTGSPLGIRDARYSHMSQINVPLGKRVRKGEIIGRAGDTGSATAVHLHFGMKNIYNNYIDPHRFFTSVDTAAIDYAPSGSENEEDGDMPTPEEMRQYVREGVHDYFDAVAERDSTWARAVGDTHAKATQNSTHELDARVGRVGGQNTYIIELLRGIISKLEEQEAEGAPDV